LAPQYPPFRLDQGVHEPDGTPTGPVSSAVRVPDSPGGGVAGPVTALIAGVLLLAPGTALTVGGGAVLALDTARDSSGYVTSPALSVQSTTTAITAEGITLQAGDLWTRGFADIGGVRVTATGSPR